MGTLNPKFEQEISDFRENFKDFHDKQIAIYGLGRRTATLLDGIKDYKIIALLDRDENSIGRTLSGISVKTMEFVQQHCDCIIINSDPSNFETIYRRIQHSKIPVYYANGEKAHIEEVDTEYENNEYWNITKEYVKEQICNHDVISFDFFDTLVMRKVVSPQEVFRIAEQRLLKKGHEIDFLTLRQQAVAMVKNNEPSFDDLYNFTPPSSFGASGTSCIKRDLLQKTELEVERDVLVPRDDVIELFRFALTEKKQVYIVSDMYLPRSFYLDVLKSLGIDTFDETHLLISCEQNASKKDGSLWKKYIDIVSPVAQSIKILHIGDSYEADVLQAKKYGIDAIYLMSGIELLKNSSVASLLSRANTFQENIMLGLFIAKAFNSPFVLSKTKGKLCINDCQDFGYLVFGAMMTQFLLWLYDEVNTKNYDRILFVSRDGYFIKKDYEYLLSLLEIQKNDKELKYLLISRRIAMLMNVTDKESFEEFLRFSYTGAFGAYVYSRFNLEIDGEHATQFINAATEYETLLQWLEPYKKQIEAEIKKEQQWYRDYLHNNDFDNRLSNDVLIDTSFEGTNQYLWYKLTEKKIDGLYFYAHLGYSNYYYQFNNMKACFNNDEDGMAEKCWLKKRHSFVDSFFTAPYGMIRYIDSEGNPVCEPDKMNQMNFQKKEEANKGILRFLEDYLKLCENGKITSDFFGFLFYTMLGERVLLSDSIHDGFYFDNDFVGSKEQRL